MQNADLKLDTESDSSLKNLDPALADYEYIEILPNEHAGDQSGLLGKKLLTAGGVLVAVWLTMLTLIDGGKYIYLKHEVSLLKGQITQMSKKSNIQIKRVET